MQNKKLAFIVGSTKVSNFFNKHVIKQTQLFDDIIVFDSSEKALDSINLEKSLGPYPSIIFIDLEMPLINGWEFFERYEDMEKKVNCSIVVMYKSELLPEEEIKINQYSFILGSANKILTYDVVIDLMSGGNDEFDQLKYS